MVAGESSGDQLAEGLVKKIRQKYPDARIEGVAGPRMQKAGCDALFPMETLSVMGFIDVIKNIIPILKLRKKLLDHFKRNKPDLFIGIDAPDFNLPVEKRLKKQNVKVIHYVSPSVWAWREGRIKLIKKATDVVLAILPFEEKFYRKHHHRAVFVGHPLANKIPLNPDIEKPRQKLGFSIEKNILAILPGSRKQEVERLLTPFLQTACLLNKQYQANIQIAIPVAKPSIKSLIAHYCNLYPDLSITMLDGDSHTLLKACDYVLLASGTAALEAMLYKKPMVMAYKVSVINFLIGRLFIKIRRFSLPNILAEKDIISEFIQHQVKPQKMAEVLNTLMTNSEKYHTMVAEFYALHRKLKRDSDLKAFEVVEHLLINKPIAHE